MDEPLSNLDAKLRVEMRSVIKNIQKTVGITTIYVTHDQEEAMAVSDRIAVMNQGVIQHIGTPKNIYQRPANIFVATFIGRSNVLEGELVIKGGVPYLKLHDYEVAMPNVKEEYRVPQKIQVSIRPEELSVNRENQVGIPATIENSMFLGLNTHYFMRIQRGLQLESIHESTIENIIEPGTKVLFTVNAEKINLFTADGSTNILEGVRNDAVPSTTVTRPSHVAV
jgi:iron(III) transport system ATP-binding protein